MANDAARIILVNDLCIDGIRKFAFRSGETIARAGCRWNVRKHGSFRLRLSDVPGISELGRPTSEGRISPKVRTPFLAAKVCLGGLDRGIGKRRFEFWTDPSEYRSQSS